MREAFAGVGGGPPEELLRQVGHVMGEVLPRRWVADLLPLLDEYRPDLLVHDLATLGAGLAGEVAGVPALAHTFGRVSFDPMSDAMTDAFTALAAEYGVGVPSTPLVDICPESVQSPEFLAGVERIALRPTGWAEPGTLPSLGRPAVYVTLGTTFSTADALRTAVEGVAALPVQVLVAAGPAVGTAELTGLPDNVTVAAWVQQADVLARVDLLVHHGGSGTMLGAFAAGVPQLVMPRGADQFSNADAVVRAGAGARLLAGELSREAVTEHARALLADDAVLAGARRLAEEIAAMPSPADIARRLPDLAG